MNKHISYSLYVLHALLALSYTMLSAYELDTFYGKVSFEDPLLIKLVEHKSMQRLKHINQYGLRSFAYKQHNYSRYEHSIGVFALLKKYNASYKEQIAGLYHDISHTAFSHLGDMIYDHKDIKDSYQDSIHDKYLYACHIDQLLAPYDLTIEDIIHKKDSFKALEQDLPDLCADRIEYNLQGGFIDGLLSKDDIKSILKDLRFHDGTWYFTSVQSAHKFASVPLYLTQHVWTSSEEYMRNVWGAQLVKKAVKEGVITYDDVNYSHDIYIWDKIISSMKDEETHVLIDKVFHPKKYYTLCTDQEESCDIVAPVKFRGVNPLVYIDGKYKRLTDLDKQFAEKYHQVKKKMEKSYRIKLS
jgi:HD superfamily phosphohydrolase